MITTCTHCSARYRLDGEKVPQRVIRVRCPGCQGVFSLDGTADREESLLNDASSGFVTGFDTAPKSEPEPAPASEPAPEAAPQADPFAAPEPAPLAPEPASEAAPAPASRAAQVEPSSRGGRRRRSKEEMLARALVSDILVYNRDLRDSALAEGNLAEAMSSEIKKSWDLYKEKVTPEVANSTDCFRDALNEILADGEKVF